MSKDYIDLQNYYKRREVSRMTSAVAFAICLAGSLIIVLFAFLVSLAQGCAIKASARHCPITAAVYPEPVCPWCGGIEDGHGCQCDGGLNAIK
jgi:hypothetical protein